MQRQGGTDARRAAPSRPVSEKIFEELRRRILQRTYAPGQRLAIRDLSREFGTSITPVRDALQMLASQHLVEMSPRGASRIAELTARDIRDLYQVRLMIEPVAAELATNALTTQELHELQQLVVEVERRRRSTPSSVDSYLGALSLGEQFHRAIVRGARNQRLDAVFETLQVQLTLVRALYPVSPHSSPERMAEHRGILTALIERDAAAAAVAMSGHLEASRDDVIRRMSAPDNDVELPSSAGDEAVGGDGRLVAAAEN